MEHCLNTCISLLQTRGCMLADNGTPLNDEDCVLCLHTNTPQSYSRHYSTKVWAPHPLFYPHATHYSPPRHVIYRCASLHFPSTVQTCICTYVTMHTFAHCFTATYSHTVKIILIHAPHCLHREDTHRQTMPSFPARADPELGTLLCI